MKSHDINILTRKTDMKDYLRPPAEILIVIKI